VDSDPFLHTRVEPAPDPYRTGFGCGFRFSPAGAPETQKTSKPEKKPERNPKTGKNQTKPEIREKTRKKLEKALKRNIFTKSDGHLNLT
jgi:hypothetical protein